MGKFLQFADGLWMNALLMQYLIINEISNIAFFF